jgi:hypothetical protein
MRILQCSLSEMGSDCDMAKHASFQIKAQRKVTSQVITAEYHKIDMGLLGLAFR